MTCLINCPVLPDCDDSVTNPSPSPSPSGSPSPSPSAVTSLAPCGSKSSAFTNMIQGTGTGQAFLGYNQFQNTLNQSFGGVAPVFAGVAAIFIVSSMLGGGKR